MLLIACDRADAVQSNVDGAKVKSPPLPVPKEQLYDCSQITDEITILLPGQ